MTSPENPIVSQPSPEVQHQNHITEPSQDTSASPETQEQINWKKFREVRDKERKEKEASDRMAMQKKQEADALKAALEAIVNKPSADESFHDEYESDEQKIDRKVQEALAKRDQKMAQERSERELQELPHRLNSVYSDFKNVCNEENLDYLEYHHPEVAQAFQNQPHSFDKWSSVYKAIKRLIPNADSKRDEEKAKSNMARPQSMSVAGVSATGDRAPLRVDDEVKRQNWERMQRIRRGV